MYVNYHKNRKNSKKNGGALNVVRTSRRAGTREVDNAAAVLTIVRIKKMRKKVLEKT